MRIPTGISGRVLPCLLCLAAVWPLAGALADKGQDSPKKPAELKALAAETLKGEAKVSVHSYKMLSGNIYRLTAKGEDFVPLVRVQGQSGIFTNPTGSPGANAALFKQSNVAQIIFIPRDTKVYQIQVNHALGTEIKKGPHAYTLSIERAVFTPRVAVEDPHLEVGEHSKRLEQGKLYSITVTGTGFAPEVQIMEGSRVLARAFNGRWFGFGPDAEFVTTLTLTPARTADYRILVAVGPVTEHRTAPLTYSTQIVELKVELSLNEQLTKQDPVYPRRGGPHKLHKVKLAAGKTYQIDMTSRAFDAYLFLEDSAGQVLMDDDDSGEGLNARLIFRPTKTETYVIVATTYNRGATAGGIGAYALTVAENPHAQPKFPTPSPFGKGATNFPK